MISRPQAQALYDYYDKQIGRLTEAMVALSEGGVKSYSIDDRSLTRFDLNTLGREIDEAVLKRAEYDALRKGRRPRRAVGVVPHN